MSGPRLSPAQWVVYAAYDRDLVVVCTGDDVEHLTAHEASRLGRQLIRSAQDVTGRGGPPPLEHASEEDDGRPDFIGFAEALRVEADGTERIHRNDKTGQAQSDAKRLRELADRIVGVGDDMGYCSRHHENRVVMSELATIEMGKVLKAPATPGVYVLVGTRGVVNYVGKCLNIQASLREHLSIGDVPTTGFRFEVIRDEERRNQRERELLTQHTPDYNVVHSLGEGES